ncbi:hypothetical protein P7K49_005530 [Saguinus oedipus]|uniref:Uncharacterized protein n=1 Tax=Saguinus oedipus TaxID=9490 RepID=A0ABQ9VZU0_SAGOE|nr:hypothetical protein P7K49_005530 [Saguinus oedipus]
MFFVSLFAIDGIGSQSVGFESSQKRGRPRIQVELPNLQVRCVKEELSEEQAENQNAREGQSGDFLQSPDKTSSLLLRLLSPVNAAKD